MTRLTLLQLNDLHGYLEPHPEVFWSSGEVYREAGGLARVASVFERAREDNPGGVLALDNGDTLHGTFPAVESEGEALVPVLNALGFDAMTAHWEFAYGPERFRSVAEGLDYPVLAANVYREGSGRRPFPASRVFERNGAKVGVVGLACNIVDKTMPASFSEGLEFTLGREEAEREVERLREEEGVELVVLLSHLGYPQEVRLAGELDGVDVLLSGHTHNRSYEAREVGGTVLFQSGCHGSFVGRLDLRLGEEGVEEWSHELIHVSPEFEEEGEVAELMEEAVGPHRPYLEEGVAEAEAGFSRSRVAESSMDNLLLEAVRQETGRGIAFSNGWRYGAPVPPGPVTMRDVWNVVPADPPISTCLLSGEEMWDMVEEDLELTFSRDPFGQMGGYVKRCLGIEVYFKAENPEGHRVQELHIGGEPVEPGEEYEVAYLSVQGVPEGYGRGREVMDVSATEALESYLREEERVSPGLRGSVVPI